MIQTPMPQSSNADPAKPALATCVRRATVADRLPVFRMLELYQHDLSDIWDQDIDAQGEYGYRLDRYWDNSGSDSDCHPFVATVDGKYAGFALVDGAVKVGSAGYWMDQFFVLKKYRRTGLGSVLARQVFAALPGSWEVGQMTDNHAAQSFWREVISQYTDGQFVERKLTAGWWQGSVQCFTSGKPTMPR